VLIFFRADIVAMLKALPGVLAPNPGPDARRIRLIVVGTVPIVVVGLLWADVIEGGTRTPAVAAVALLVGAALLLLIERLGRAGRGEESLSMVGALTIGIAQSLALIPGISRSGSTIAAGMALGLRRDVAARFTFLMSIPAIIAAAAKEGLELRHLALTGADAMMFAVGMVSSAVVGYLTVKYFIRYLASHRLDVFAWYRIGLAVLTFVWMAQR
jgi:undecaprenyl-diphosphatase